MRKRPKTPKLKVRSNNAVPGRARAKAVVAPQRRREKVTVRIFVSYSHRDIEALDRLHVHLAPLKTDKVTTWYDGDLDAGDKLDTEIARELRSADIFVGLLSPDYLASNYCWNIEYSRAMNRRARGKMRVVAVVLKHCDWKSTTAAGFKLLPADGRPVSRWRTADEAFLNVAQGIRRVVAAVRKGVTSEAKTTSRKVPTGRASRAAAKSLGKPAAKRDGAAKARKPAPRAKVAVRTAAKARTVARPKTAAKTGVKKARTVVRRRAKSPPKRR